MIKSGVFIVLMAALMFAHYGSTKMTYSEINPYTLYDQAEDELKILRQVVDAAIQTASNQLDEVISSKYNSAQVVKADSIARIQDEVAKIDEMVTDIQDLAISADVDIDPCLGGEAYYLDVLPVLVIGDLETCIDDVNGNITQEVKYAERELASDANNVVKDLNDELDACTTGSILCVSPVLRQIESAITVLPEIVEQQAQTASILADDLVLEIDGCSSSKLSQYGSIANSVLAGIQKCVDNILG